MKAKREGGNSINIMIERQWVEQVNQFRYLGSLISDDGNCIAEIKNRIATDQECIQQEKRAIFKKIE